MDWFGLGTPFWTAIVIILVIWEVVWKGIALWRAARNSHRVWFVWLLILNTVGILSIIYILAFSKRKSEPKQAS